MRTPLIDKSALAKKAHYISLSSDHTQQYAKRFQTMGTGSVRSETLQKTKEKKRKAKKVDNSEGGTYSAKRMKDLFSTNNSSVDILAAALANLKSTLDRKSTNKK